MESLRVAANGVFVDDQLGTRLMRDSIKTDANGQPVVVNPDGSPALNASLENLSLTELAERIANQKPFLEGVN
jgi:hypothetical protein